MKDQGIGEVDIYIAGKEVDTDIMSCTPNIKVE
jgi:hypothetical protein